MALYAADIEVRLKNKGELTRLEKQFKKLADVSIQLDKTLKSLGKSNVIRVDTRGALSAINLLETKIKGLSRTVSVNATTSGGRRNEGGMSGMAVPMMAAMSGRPSSSSSSRSNKIDIFDKGDDVFRNHIKGLTKDIQQQEKIVDNYGETASRAWNKHSKAVELYNKHQEKTTRTLDELDKRAVGNKLNKFAKGFLPATAAKNFETFSKAYLRTNSDVADLMQKQNKAVVDNVQNQKVQKEIAEQNLFTEQDKLQNKREVLKLSKRETENTIRNALMTDEERNIHRDINKHKTKGFEALAESYRNQEKINEALAKGKKPATSITDAFVKSREEIKKNFKEVVRLREELSKPIPRKGMMGFRGMMGSMRGGMKSLGKGGMLGSLGKGMLGASAMIPGMAPLAIGAGLGGAGKSGGAALVGGAAGLMGGGLLMGGVALAGIANSSAKAQAEFKKMKVALEGVTPSFSEYTNALDHVSELSDKYASSQKDTITNFTKLQASASASGFSVDEVAEAYEGLQAGTIATGGDQEKLNGVMLAASQIFAKGKVAAEEIRGQISERLPGTMALFAESMGISGKALDKLLQEGKVTMEDFLNFTRHLKKVHGETALSMVEDSANAGQKLSKQWNDLILNIGTITQPVGAALQTMLAGVLEQINNISEKFINLLGLTKEARIEKLQQKMIDTQTKLFELEERKILRDAGVKVNRFKGGELLGNLEFESRETQKGSDTLGSSGALGSIPLASGADRTRNNVEDEKRNKLQDDLNKMLEEFNKLTGKNIKLKGLEDETSTEADKAKLAQWKQIEAQLKSQLQYQQDLNQHGREYADTQKMINDLVDQFGGKRDIIEDWVNKIKDAEKAGKSAKAVYEDWLDGIEKRLKELENPMYQLTTLVDAASDSFRDSFKEMVKGTKSVGDAFVDMFNRIADAYLDMVAETIAAQASKGIGSFFKNLGLNFMSSAASGSFQYSNAPSMNYGYENLSSPIKFSSGGYTDRPTNAVIGDAGPEYVLREDQMAGALARFSSGQRGQSVIPVAGSSSSGGIGGGGNVTVSYTGPTLNFNGDEYVPRSSVPEIINAAARQGAKAGEAKMMSNLRNNRGTRASVGL